MTKPQINKTLINYIDSLLNKGINIDPEVALIYAFATEYNLIHRLYELGIFKHRADEEAYRIHLVQDDVDNTVGIKRMYKCRIPLFEVNTGETDYKSFYKQLVTDSRSKPYISKLDNLTEGKEAFEELLFKYEDFDLNKFIEATVAYYRETEFSKKLSNYLKENAEATYLSFEKKKSKLI